MCPWGGIVMSGFSVVDDHGIVLSLVSCLPPALPAFVVIPATAGVGNLRGGVVGCCTGKASVISLFIYYLN